MANHIQHGIGSVRRYIHGPLTLIEFVANVLDAIELERPVFSSESCL